MAGIVIQMERTTRVIRFINAIVVDAIRFGSEQRIVTVIDHGHGKAGAEMGDSGELPALCPAVDGKRGVPNGIG